MAASNAAPDWVYNYISKDVAMLGDRVDGVLFDSQPVSDNVLERLNGLGTVRTLDIGSCSLTDSAIPHIAEPSELNSLLIGRNKIPDKGASHLPKLMKLEHLQIHETPLTNAGLVYVGWLARLTDLDLNHTKITGVGLTHLAKLEELNLTGTAIDDGSLVHLSGQPLTTLILESTPIGDEGMLHLSRITSLLRLNLTRTNVGDTGLRSLSGPVPVLPASRRARAAEARGDHSGGDDRAPQAAPAQLAALQADKVGHRAPQGFPPKIRARGPGV